MGILDIAKSFAENWDWISHEFKGLGHTLLADHLLRDDMPPEEIGRAVESALEGAAVLGKNGEATGQAAALRLAARGLQMLGRFPESVGPAERALEVARAANDREMAMFSLGTLAFSKMSLGDSQAALIAAEEAWEIAKTLGPEVEAARALEFGQICAQLGRFIPAISLFSSSLPVLRETNDRTAGLLAAGYASFGQALLVTGNPEEALHAFEHGAEIASRHQRRRTYAQCLGGMGSILFFEGRLDEARRAMQIAVEVLKSSQRGPRGLSSALLFLGMIEQTAGHFGAAQTAFEESLAVARQAGEPWATAEACTALGGLYFFAGTFDRAEVLLRRSADLSEQLREQSRNDDPFRIALGDRFGAEYGYLQLILQSRGDAYGALGFSERARARALMDLVAMPGQGSEPSENRPFREQVAEFAASTRTTFVEYSLIPVLDEEAIQSETGEISFRNELLIYVVPPDGSAVALCSKPKEFYKHVAKLLGVPGTSTIASAKPDARSLGWKGQSSEERNHAWLRLIHESLIEPIAGLLPANPDETVVLIPQGDIYSVPFPALPSASGVSLIDRHTLLTAPSIQTHIRFHQRKQESGYRHSYAALVAGNPVMPTTLPDGSRIDLRQLLYAETEALSVAKLYGVAALTGVQAVKAQILKQMPDARVVHIATHGLLDSSPLVEQPGAIVLTAVSGDSGLLTCEELAGLSLHCDLVVLSACDTGKGRMTNDGVIGLSRMLLASGARTVVIAVSKVRDDSTARLMELFHERYLNDRRGDVAGAMRDAMRATQTEFKSPDSWGLFTVMGARYSCCA